MAQVKQVDVVEKPKTVGVEQYGNVAPIVKPTPPVVQTSAVAPHVAVKKIHEKDLNDPADAVIPEGTKCKRPGCVVLSPSNVECVFHNGEPVFHEGSKGWSCCQRKVLEFDEFLIIEGCCRSAHRFVEFVDADHVLDCRFDWYQTQSTVILSVFAKKIDKLKTVVSFSVDKVSINVIFLDGKKGRFESILCQPIVPEESSFIMLSTKIECTLKKGNGMSWPTFEPSSNVTSWTTFGTSGQTGTVGSKTAIIASDSPVALMK